MVYERENVCGVCGMSERMCVVWVRECVWYECSIGCVSNKVRITWIEIGWMDLLATQLDCVLWILGVGWTEEDPGRLHFLLRHYYCCCYHYYYYYYYYYYLSYSWKMTMLCVDDWKQLMLSMMLQLHHDHLFALLQRQRHFCFDALEIVPVPWIPKDVANYCKMENWVYDLISQHLAQVQVQVVFLLQIHVQDRVLLFHDQSTQQNPFHSLSCLILCNFRSIKDLRWESQKYLLLVAVVRKH